VERSEVSSLGDVMIQAVGLTGAIAIGALGLGIFLASGIIVFRKLQARRMTDADAAQTQSLGLTPTSRE
jgi:hypothetical protein